MSKRVYELFLFDIYIAILKIEYVSNKFQNAESLKYDFISWDSVIREFEIIGEATNTLIKNNFLDKENQVVVDLRNLLIHHYILELMLMRFGMSFKMISKSSMN